MTIRIIFFVEYITSLLCGTFTLFVFGSLLYSELSSTPPKFNKSLQLYAFTECLLSTSLLIHFTYLTLIWLGMPPNAFILFFTGGIQTTLFIVSSIAVTTLGIDRCLGIAFPTRKRGPACGFNFVAMNAIFLVINVWKRLFSAFPGSPNTACKTFGCLLSYHENIVYFILRCAGSLINFIIGIILVILLQKCRCLNSNMLKSSKIIILTLFITLTLDLMPHLLSAIIYEALELQLGDYAGPYSSVIGCVPSALCAAFYFNGFNSLKSQNT